MTLKDAAALAFSSIQGAKLRAFLTILGLAVGIGSVLTVIALGEAGEYRVEAEISKLGLDKVWIRSGSGRAVLTTEHAEAIRTITGTPVCASGSIVSKVRVGNKMTDAIAIGFDQGFEMVHQPKLIEGRNLLHAEFENGKAVCLIDEALAEALGDDLLGRWLMTGNRLLRIVGVIERMAVHTPGMNGGMVILPLDTFMVTYAGHIHEIAITVQQGQMTRHISNQALAALPADADCRADTLEKEIGAAREIVRIFVMVLACVAVVCMITGGIGVMNVLLISVRERRHEIGVMKAIGGTGLQLGSIFLIEAMIYGLIGMVLGTAMGVIMINLFSKWIGLTTALNVRQLMNVLLASIGVSLGAGVLPAYRAAGMLPVDALKPI